MDQAQGMFHTGNAMEIQADERGGDLRETNAEAVN